MCLYREEQSGRAHGLQCPSAARNQHDSTSLFFNLLWQVCQSASFKPIDKSCVLCDPFFIQLCTKWIGCGCYGYSWSPTSTHRFAHSPFRFRKGAGCGFCHRSGVERVVCESSFADGTRLVRPGLTVPYGSLGNYNYGTHRHRRPPKVWGIKDAGSTVPLCTARAKAFVLRLTLFVTLWSITTSWEMRI